MRIQLRWLIALWALLPVSVIANAQPVPNCLFPDDRTVAPDWVCDEPFQGFVSSVGESDSSEKDALEMAVQSFRSLLTEHFENIFRGMLQDVDLKGSATTKFFLLIRGSVAKFPIESRLKPLAKVQSKAGAFFVAAGVPGDQFPSLMLDIYATWKTHGAAASILKKKQLGGKTVDEAFIEQMKH